RGHLRGVQGDGELGGPPRPQADGEADLSVPRHREERDAKGGAPPAGLAPPARLAPPPAPPPAQPDRLDGILAGEARAHRVQPGVPRVDEPVGDAVGDEARISPNVLALLAAITAGALGPRIFGSQDKSAGVPFDYRTPDGFVTA